MNILDELGIENATQADCANVAYVCSQVSTRAAHLCAAGTYLLESALSAGEWACLVIVSRGHIQPVLQSHSWLFRHRIAIESDGEARGDSRR